MLKIAIIGTRGIPNHYGGFEQFAEYLAVGLVSKGFQVSVYNSHNHPYSDPVYKGVRIIHQFDPEYKYGTFGQFIYDRSCIKDCRKRDFDIVLQLGYTSSSIWHRKFPKQSFIMTNMDGLEWKRSKYSKPVQIFLKLAEKWAVKYSDLLIADSVGIQSYLKEKYNNESVYIPYGADLPGSYDESTVKEFSVEQKKYFLLIARMEPENNIEMILDGFVHSGSDKVFIVIGKTDNKFGQYLRDKYKNYPLIKFIGSLYDQDKLYDLRYYSLMYFHGHSVGGTNPSLLEAMASQCVICAHENEFNRGVVNNDAFFFSNSDEIARILSISEDVADKSVIVNNNLKKIRTIYSWDNIIQQYADLFEKTLKKEVCNG